MEKSVYLLINSYLLSLSSYNSSRLLDEQKELHEELLKSKLSPEGFYTSKAAQEIYSIYKTITEETQRKLDEIRADLEKSEQQLKEVLAALNGGKILWKYTEGDPLTELWLEDGEIKFFKRPVEVAK